MSASSISIEDSQQTSPPAKKVVDVRKATDKEIRNSAGTVAGLGGLSLFFGALLHSPDAIVSGLIIFVLGFLVAKKKSRVVAVCLFALCASAVAIRLVLQSGPLVALIGCWYSWRAMKATFAWHSLTKTDVPRV